jgi:hypothetical protein
MVDKIQASGTVPNLAWTDPTGSIDGVISYANHRGGSGVSKGGNFLNEDGSVRWRNFDLGRYKTTIDVGSAASGWTVFYRPGDIDGTPN